VDKHNGLTSTTFLEEDGLPLTGKEKAEEREEGL
jgi:hypothetical protein